MRVYNYDNEPFDFCRKCSPHWASILEVQDEELYDVDCQHVDYEEAGYECDKCGKKLTEKD